MYCQAAERKLVIPVDRTRDDLIAPIIELSKVERIRFLSDELESYIETCNNIVMLLNVEKIQSGPLLSPFLSLIANEHVRYNFK